MTSKSKYAGLGVALGAALGAVFGVIAGNIGVWLGIGVAIGTVIGMSIRSGESECPECKASHEVHRPSSSKLGANS